MYSSNSNYYYIPSWAYPSGGLLFFILLGGYSPLPNMQKEKLVILGLPINHKYFSSVYKTETAQNIYRIKPDILTITFTFVKSY